MKTFTEFNNWGGKSPTSLFSKALRLSLPLVFALIGGTTFAQSEKYTTGFESSDGFTASSSYDNKSESFSGSSGKQWATVYGTPTTTDKISDSQSLQMRIYASQTIQPYTRMDFDLTNIEVTSVSFTAKYKTLENSVTLQYSTDGGTSWETAESFSLSTTAATYTYTPTESIKAATIRFKILVDTYTSASAPSRVTLDDFTVMGNYYDGGYKVFAFSETAATATMGSEFTAPTLTNEYETTVSYSSSNTEVATVDASTGAVTLVAAGETTITATDGTNSASYTLTVKSQPSENVDEITISSFGGGGSNYDDYDQYTSSTTGVVYNGNGANGKSSQTSAIQLRSTANSDNSHSGIIAYSASRTLISIEVEWNSKTSSGRTLNVYGKTSAYSSPTELFSASSSTQGTKLGTIVYGTSTTLEVESGSYNAVGLCSNSGALYIDKITFTWSDGTTETQGSFTIGEDGYATYYDAKAYVMPEGVKGGIITKADISETSGESGTLTISYEYEAGETVPAGTALLLKGDPDTYTFEYTTSDKTAPTGNMLHGADAVDSDKNTYVDGKNVKYYLLSHYNGKLGFFWYAAEGAAIPYQHPYAFLAVDFGDSASGVKMFTLNEESTGIRSLAGDEDGTRSAAIYTLAGQRVSGMTKGGLYIVNGKKVLVK